MPRRPPETRTTNTSEAGQTNFMKTDQTKAIEYIHTACKGKTLQVVFRTEKDGSVTALFPYTVSFEYGISFCIGIRQGTLKNVQPWITEETKPATPEQYKPLLDEMQKGGVVAQVLRRMPSDGDKTRHKIWEQMKQASWGF